MTHFIPAHPGRAAGIALKSPSLTSKYDLAGIQGIPGFYQKFDYRYAITLENHLNINLNEIQFKSDSNDFEIRHAVKEDISFLQKEEEQYRKDNFLSVSRNAEHWEYIFGKAKDSEYGSDLLIFESEVEKFYCRIMYYGFGKGLIISEISRLWCYVNFEIEQD